jgi:hypothetical protein
MCADLCELCVVCVVCELCVVCVHYGCVCVRWVRVCTMGACARCTRTMDTTRARWTRTMDMCVHDGHVCVHTLLLYMLCYMAILEACVCALWVRVCTMGTCVYDGCVCARTMDMCVHDGHVCTHFSYMLCTHSA